MSAEVTTAWTALLDQMETEVSAVEAGEQAFLNPWQPPVDFPPLPDELADRARDLVRRQQSVLAYASDERAQLAKHIAAVKTIPTFDGLGNRPSVYLDITG